MIQGEEVGERGTVKGGREPARQPPRAITNTILSHPFHVFFFVFSFLSTCHHHHHHLPANLEPNKPARPLIIH